MYTIRKLPIILAVFGIGGYVLWSEVLQPLIQPVPAEVWELVGWSWASWSGWSTLHKLTH